MQITKIMTVVLDGFTNLSLKFRFKLNLRVFENRVLRTILWFKRQTLKISVKIWHMEEFH
jgi:hypothetical protein